MKLKILLSAICLAGIQSCMDHPDLEKEKKAILALHNEQKKAHLEKDIDLLLGDGSDDFIEVNRGVVKKPTREESRTRFQSYFDAVDFVKWDDVSPPVFSFSDDATMATTIVQKIVITKQKLENNRLDTAYYAWLAIYQKNKDKWKMTRMASTRQ